MSDPILVDSGGNIAVVTSAQLVAQYPGATATATSVFALTFNGTINYYNAGNQFVVTPDLLAALNAAGAPFTQP